MPPKAKKKSRRDPWHTALTPTLCEKNGLLTQMLVAAANEGVKSISDFHTKFERFQSCSVPYATFKEWLKLTGMISHFQRPTSITFTPSSLPLEGEFARVSSTGNPTPHVDARFAVSPRQGGVKDIPGQMTISFGTPTQPLAPTTKSEVEIVRALGESLVDDVLNEGRMGHPPEARPLDAHHLGLPPDNGNRSTAIPNYGVSA